MSVTVDTAFVKQYQGNVRLLQQQLDRRFREGVRVETLTGEEGYFEQIAKVAAQVRTSRHADTPLISTPHDRRQVSAKTYEFGDLIDDSDRLQMLIDPASSYAMNAASAFNRAEDEAIIEAAHGTAKTGKNAGDTETWSDVTTANSTLEIDNSRTLHTEDMVEAKESLDTLENDASQGYNFALSAKNIRHLLTESAPAAGGLSFAPAVHADYTDARGMMTGDVTHYVGFNVIKTEFLVATAQPGRECIAWAKNSILLGVSKEPTAKIDLRVDKSYSTQVFMDARFGATRMDGKGVVKVIVDD